MQSPSASGHLAGLKHPGGVYRLAQTSHLLMVFLLAWMKAPLIIGGLNSYPADAAFAAAFSLWLIALIRGEIRFRFHGVYWLLLAYFAAMVLSLTGSDDPSATAFKLLTQLYLLTLPVLTFNLVRTLTDLRRLFTWWLSGTAVVALIGAVTLLLYSVDGADPLVSGFIHTRTTLPPGPYLRLELTFSHPAMLANYLGTSLMLLLIAERLGWMANKSAIVLGGGVLLCTVFTLTPGLGGILFMLAVWLWYWTRGQRPFFARAVLVAGSAMPVLAVLLASVTTPHPTAPFLVHIPGLPVLAPAVRLLAWIDAFRNFLETPLTGKGMGLDAVSVYMETRYCNLTAVCVTDAHNTFLSLAAQAGAIGLGAFCAIVWFVVRQMSEKAPRSDRDVIVFGLALAWLAGMTLQGLVGSFEDTRHLWLFLGMLLSASCAGAGEPLKGKADDLRPR